MICSDCRETSIKEHEPPLCISSFCPVDPDLLPPRAQRLLKIRGLLVGLNELNLAERICREYAVDLDDLKILADIEALLKELNPPKGQDNG